MCLAESPIPDRPSSVLVAGGGLTKLEVYNDKLEEENLAAQPAARAVKVKDLPQYVKDMNSDEKKFQNEFKVSSYINMITN